MDAISNEAKVDSFSIGPTSIVGRTIALRILLCKTMSRVRHQIFQFLKEMIARLIIPYVSWFHPRNPQGILFLVSLIAFLLKRYTNVKSKAESAFKRKFWRNMMRTALTYEEWAHAAKMLDKETPKMNESHLYDEELVRNKVQELRHRRHEGSLREIMFYMRADLVRNLGNMCNPELHKGRLQVPKLIKEYIDEVSTQLRIVCNSDSEELLLEEKFSFMHEIRHAFGRTALLLSGGASLGAFHIGVVKTLVESKLLPRIIAGSSVGSIMCSVVATKSWPELQSFFEDSWHSLKFFDQMDGIFTVVKRLMTQGAVHEIRQLQIILRRLTSNLTFQEAYDMTGRVLGITVCSPRKHEPPRCLNYLTSPHVVIWSAVTASCAFPGLFEAQELMAKDRRGNIVPYHPPFQLGPDETSDMPDRRWRDGSLESDLPMMQLKELFNVNHFIVSQANPHIAPLLRLKELIRAYGGSFAAKLAHLMEMEVKHRCNQVLELGFPMGGLAKLFAQEWEGDITVVIPATLAQYSKIIQNPSYMELQKAANQGRRCTWEKLSAIKANCGIELVLDECVAILNQMRRQKRSEERAAAMHTTLKFNGSKRIPSWNCIARENSAGSLEEDAFVDSLVSSCHHSGNSHARGSSIPNFRSCRNVQDVGSDSESETADLNSWTRSGGPLMRTASADKFVNFVQNLDIDTELNKTWIREQNNQDGCEIENSPTFKSSSVVLQMISCEDSQKSSSRITEYPDPDHESDNYTRVHIANSGTMPSKGDLLQLDRTHNGMTFNVVKKEDVSTIVILDNGSEQSNSRENCLSECVQLEGLDKDMESFNGSSASDCEDDELKPLYT